MKMRFVNVDDFKKEIMECNADPINEFDLGWDTWGIFNAIDRTPTADVQPVVHAHWIERQLSDRGEFEFCCSNCEHTYYGYDIPGNYCPNCGAKMDEEVQ